MNSDNNTLKNASGKTVTAIKCADYSPEKVGPAVQDLLGGAPEAGGPLVSKGDTVLIKPNLLSPRDPEEAVTTHPAVVQAVVEYCFLAGAGRVWIGDSCAGEHKDQQLWEATGMAEVTRVTGAELKSFESEVVACKCGSTQLPVPGWLDEVDLWISVPKLKTHTLTVLTCAVKNTYGMVAGRVKAYYHGQYPSPQAMSRFLLQVHESLPPAYVVVDAVMAMEGNGPSNGTPAPAGLIIGGRDALAIDATCAPIFQSRTQDIPILRAALNKTPHVLDNIVVRGDGRELLDKISLKPSLGRLLLKLPEAVFGLATAVLACRPRINAEKCIACGACARICSQKAISSIPHKDSYKIDVSRCIMCMCCAEACPCHAVEVKSPLRFFQALRRLLAGKRK